MPSIDKGVIVCEFDEWATPETLDRFDLGNDICDRLQFISRRDHRRSRTKLAPEGASSLSLDRQSVVSIQFKKIMSRHRRMCEIKTSPSTVVNTASWCAGRQYVRYDLRPA